VLYYYYYYFADTILKYIKTPHAGHAVFMAVMYSGKSTMIIVMMKLQ